VPDPPLTEPGIHPVVPFAEAGQGRVQVVEQAGQDDRHERHDDDLPLLLEAGQRPEERRLGRQQRDQENQADDHRHGDREERTQDDRLAELP
jgi:hypothetical protein